MYKNKESARITSKPYTSGLSSPILELHPHHKKEILGHLLALNPEDRRLRFGTLTSDDLLRAYVDHIDFENDAVFACFDDDLKLIGLAHLAYFPRNTTKSHSAEFGVSVLPQGRGRGIGTALLERAAIHARNTSINTLFVHCLANNGPMMRLARKSGMEVGYAYGDADAYLKLPPANTSSIVEEASNEQWAGLDYALKENLKRTHAAWKWLLRTTRRI